MFWKLHLSCPLLFYESELSLMVWPCLQEGLGNVVFAGREWWTNSFNHRLCNAIWGSPSRLSIMRCYTSHKWLIDCNFLHSVLGILKDLTHWKRLPSFWERLKAGEEGDNRGWDGWMASPTRWTWVWASSGSWWWTGRPGMPEVHGVTKSQTRLSHWTKLNWHKSQVVNWL